MADCGLSAKARGIIEVKRRNLEEFAKLEHCGMAILIAPRIALTCAHVVNAALHRRLDHPKQPSFDDQIILTFPVVSAGTPFVARVVNWSNSGTGQTDDLALLQLDKPAPEEAGTAILAELPVSAVDVGPWSVFGVPGIGGVGRHVPVRLQRDATTEWQQLSVVTGVSFEPGFSGAGVWDSGHQGTIGMAVRYAEGDGTIAYFIPATALVRFAGDIPHERRVLSSAYARTFTVFAALFLVAALLHMLGDRIHQFPSFLTLGQGNDILSAFWGLHIVAIGLPILLMTLLRFARAFQEHPWWMRVPQFGFFGAPARPTATRAASVVTVVALVVVPLYMNGHFLRRLHDDDTKVYINAPLFGSRPGTLRECGPSLNGRYCVHDEASLYSRVKPISGASGGYFNNAYHIGAHDRAKTRGASGSVTFFPILQPLFLLGLAGASVLLAGRFLWRLARPAARTIDKDAPTLTLPQSTEGANIKACNML